MSQTSASTQQRKATKYNDENINEDQEDQYQEKKKKIPSKPDTKSNKSKISSRDEEGELNNGDTFKPIEARKISSPALSKKNISVLASADLTIGKKSTLRGTSRSKNERDDDMMEDQDENEDEDEYDEEEDEEEDEDEDDDDEILKTPPQLKSASKKPQALPNPSNSNQPASNSSPKKSAMASKDLSSSNFDDSSFAFGTRSGSLALSAVLSNSTVSTSTPTQSTVTSPTSSNSPPKKSSLATKDLSSSNLDETNFAFGTRSGSLALSAALSGNNANNSSAGTSYTNTATSPIKVISSSSPTKKSAIASKDHSKVEDDSFAYGTRSGSLALSAMLVDNNNGKNGNRANGGSSDSDTGSANTTAKKSPAKQSMKGRQGIAEEEQMNQDSQSESDRDTNDNLSNGPKKNMESAKKNYYNLPSRSQNASTRNQSSRNNFGRRNDDDEDNFNDGEKESRVASISSLAANTIEFEKSKIKKSTAAAKKAVKKSKKILDEENVNLNLQNMRILTNSDLFDDDDDDDESLGSSEEQLVRDQLRKIQSARERFPDPTPILTIMQYIGKNEDWTDEEVNGDVEILKKNRIRTAKDVRKVSMNTWKEITNVLPVTKDLLREAVGWDESDTVSMGMPVSKVKGVQW